MNNTVARWLGMALLCCVGVLASPALAKSAVPTLRPRVCPLAYRVQLKRDFRVCDDHACDAFGTLEDGR
jgi:hypothetical protein